MKKVNITTCCILYPVNEMVKDRVTVRMPFLVFRFSHIVIFAERLVRTS